MTEGLKLKHYQKFISIRRVEMLDDAKLSVLIGLTRYIFTGSGDIINAWYRKFTSLRISLSEEKTVSKSKVVPSSGPIEQTPPASSTCKSTMKERWFFVIIIGMAFFLLLGYGKLSFMFLLGFWILDRLDRK